jgi:cytochrome c5
VPGKKTMAIILRISSVLFAMLLFSTCSSGSSQNQVSTEEGIAFAGYEINEDVMGKWTRSCALCHLNGEAGAPVLGDSAAWEFRLAQGEDIVMRNVLDGLNSMPPLGYCMACEVDDFRALIGFMAGTSP